MCRASQQHEYFADGLTEEFLNVLVKDSRATGNGSRTSSFAFKGKNEHAAAIIAKQAARSRYLLEGSVRKEGDKVPITAQLDRRVHDG